VIGEGWIGVRSPIRPFGIYHRYFYAGDVTSAGLFSPYHGFGICQVEAGMPFRRGEEGDYQPGKVTSLPLEESIELEQFYKEKKKRTLLGK
jgi:hypothetical protein